VPSRSYLIAIYLIAIYLIAIYLIAIYLIAIYLIAIQKERFLRREGLAEGGGHM